MTLSAQNVVRHLIHSSDFTVKARKVNSSNKHTFLHYIVNKGYSLQSSLVFLMLCSTQNFCWSNILSFCSKSASSDFNSISLLLILCTLSPGIVPLFKKQTNIYRYYKTDLHIHMQAHTAGLKTYFHFTILLEILSIRPTPSSTFVMS